VQPAATDSTLDAIGRAPRRPRDNGAIVDGNSAPRRAAPRSAAPPISMQRA